MTRDALRYALASSTRAAESSGPAFTRPVVAAPSGRMSWSHRAHGIPRALAETIVGNSAGKQGDTATRTSGRPVNGAASASEAMYESSCRIRAAPLSRPIHSGSRSTRIPSRVSQ